MFRRRLAVTEAAALSAVTLAVAPAALPVFPVATVLLRALLGGYDASTGRAWGAIAGLVATMGAVATVALTALGEPGAAGAIAVLWPVALAVLGAAQMTTRIDRIRVAPPAGSIVRRSV